MSGFLDKPPTPVHRELVPLTGIRSLAALWVFFYHSKSELIRAFPGQSWFIEGVTGCGYLGVDLFFTLSGFILAYNYSGLCSNLKRGDYLRYLWLRLARIYPVHLFTLILFVIAVLGAKLCEIGLTKPEFYNTADFFWNIFLVQAWSFPVRPSWNTLSWSVSCEWLAYLTLPFWLLIHRGRSTAAHITLYGILAVALVFICHSIRFDSTFGYGLIRILFEFNLGIIAYHLFNIRFAKELHWTAIMLVSSVVVFVTPYFIREFDFPVFLLSPVFGVIILGLSYENSLFSRILSWRPLVYGGYVSYSFYMIHELILLVARKAYSYSPATLQPLANFLWIPLVLLATAIAATCIHHFIEEPSRVFMRSRLNSRDRNRKEGIC